MSSVLSSRPKRLLTERWIILIPAIIVAGMTVNFYPAILALVFYSLVLGYFWSRRDTLILFLIIYTPFEELVLKISPDFLYAPLRYAWEGMLFVFIGLIILEKLVLTRDWKKSKIDFLLLAFVLAWFASGIINGTPFIFSLMHLKNLVRYIAIFYIIYNLNPDRDFLKKVMKVLMAIGAIQAVICIGQAIEGDMLVSLFRPKEIVVGGELIRNADAQAGSYYTSFTGSFPRSNELGYYLASVICFLVAAYYLISKKPIFLLMITLTTAALLLSSSRISWISAFIGVGIILMKIRHRFRFLYFLIPLILLTTLMAGSTFTDFDSLTEDFNIWDRFHYLFSAEYFDNVKEAGRLYAVLYAVPAVSSANPLLGIGPGSFMNISNRISPDDTFAEADKLGLESKPLNYIHDVGYAALYIQVGLIGLLALVGVFVRLYRSITRAIVIEKDRVIRAFLYGSIGFLVATAIQNLASFNLMYRNQALLIWTVCGLIAVFTRTPGAIGLIDSETGN